MKYETAAALTLLISWMTLGCSTTTTAGSDQAPVPASVTEHADSLQTTAGNVFGTLVLPARRLPVPVVLIISGSGPTDRDGNSKVLSGNGNNLKMLADGLASQGVASLRYDKRGVGASAAALTKEEDVRFNHFVDDAAAWVTKLEADPRFVNVTIAGHSEGSLIGMVAAREANADAYVSLEGAGRKPREVIMEQLTGQIPPPLLAQADLVFDKLEKGEKPDSVPGMLAALFRPSVQPYLMSWFKYDPPAEIAKLTIPVMIVQGSTDLQVTAEDAKRLAAAKPDAKVLTIDGMNHVLKMASGTRAEQMATYTDGSIPIVPGLVEEIVRFVNGVPTKKN